MARVEIASQSWGWLVDSNGNPQGNASATLKNLDGTNATTWSAITAGSSSTAALTSNADGTLPRFVEDGTYDMTSGGTTRRVEAVSVSRAGPFVNVLALGVRPGVGTINQAIEDYLTANPVTAQEGGITFAFPGEAGNTPYNLDSGVLELPAWVNIVGAGKRTATRFLGHADDTSVLRLRSRGGISGSFTLEDAGFQTDGVQRTFTDIDVRTAPGDAFLISNAQNCTFIGCDADTPVSASFALENGAKNNLFLRSEWDASGTAHVVSRQTLISGADHPWGAPYPGGAVSTIIDSAPNLNKFEKCIGERLNSGTGIAGVHITAGDLTLDDCELANGVTLPQILMDLLGTGVTYSNLRLNGTRITANGVASSVGIKTQGSAHGIHVMGYTRITRLATAWLINDATTVHCDHFPDYSSVTTRFTSNGGTSTENNRIRNRQAHPVEVLRPNATDGALYTGVGSAYGPVIKPDGIYMVDLSSASETNFPSIKVVTGNPEGALSARIGSIAVRIDAGATSTAIYTKQSGTGTTGWVQGNATSHQTVATDADFAVVNGGAEHTFHTGTLTAARSATLNALTAAGQRRRVTRTGTGAFNLNVLNKSGGATIKALATNQWADFLWDGTDWKLTAFGSL